MQTKKEAAKAVTPGQRRSFCCNSRMLARKHYYNNNNNNKKTQLPDLWLGYTRGIPGS